MVILYLIGLEKELRIYPFLFVFILLAAACTSIKPESATQTAEANASNTAAQILPSPSATVTYTPEPTATSTPMVCWQKGGELLELSLQSELMNLPLEFNVYLPPCYDQQPERSYPTLYLIHGQSFRQDQWQRLGATEIADTLVASGEIPPFIMIMPRDPNWRQPIETEFDEVFVQDLIPYIDANYRTNPQRQYRAIGGLSRGAGWALHFGLTEWQLFGIIGMHSLPVLWGDAYLLPTWLDDISMENMPRMYLDIGDHDRQEIKDSSQGFMQLLDERGISYEFHQYPGYHDENYWGAHIEEYIRFYAKEW